MAEYLVDASALYPLILKLREKLLLYADKLAVLDLTTYEVGNVLWKEYKKGKIKNLEIPAALFQTALSALDKLRVDNIGEVLKTAVTKNLTFYDASYIYIAEKLNVKLVTEDREMLEKCKNALNLNELLKHLTPSPNNK